MLPRTIVTGSETFGCVIALFVLVRNIEGFEGSQLEGRNHPYAG